MWMQRGAQMDAQTDEEERMTPFYLPLISGDWPLGGVSQNCLPISNLKMELLRIFWDTKL